MQLPDFRSASMTSFKRSNSGFMELLLQLVCWNDTLDAPRHCCLSLSAIAGRRSSQT
jgi:hypothetical protein